MGRLDRFRPSRYSPTPLFLDTSGLFPYFYEHAEEHPEAAAFMAAVFEGRLPYRPLFVNQHVLGETATLLLSRVSHTAAVRAIDVLSHSEAIELLAVGADRVEETVTNFRRYDDHPISFTDHTIGVQARQLDVEYVFSYDGDFETLGLTTIPHWSA